MPTPPLNASQQRIQTDASLRAERERLDHSEAERRADIADDADEVLEVARRRADVVLANARELADDVSARTPGISEQRAEEDAVVREERSVADARLRRERAVLTALTPLDRDKTNLLLLTERAGSDDALARRDDFMGIVSHDLRNLLNNIVLHATDLAEVASDTEEGRHTIHTMGKIKASVGRMNRLIGDLVDIASIDAGSLAVRREDGDVCDTVHEAVDILARVAALKGVTLTARVPMRVLSASFDEGRLLQVLNNLINNALKFTECGGTVVVEASGDGDTVTISVSDTGIGIPAAKIESVFERFVQVTNDKRGLGLGLYISRCIVSAHGGHISASSVLGVGSTFHVVLPALVSRSNAQPASTSAP